MCQPTDHQPPVTKGFMPWGISRTFTLCLVVASPIVIGDDLNKAFIEGKKEAELGISSSLAVRTKNAVKAQVDQLDKVDPMGLGETYYQMLQESQCSWYFVCHSLNGNSPAQHPTLATPEIKLTPGPRMRLKRGGRWQWPRQVPSQPRRRQSCCHLQCISMNRRAGRIKGP
jgi:hypothetical protein